MVHVPELENLKEIWDLFENVVNKELKAARAAVTAIHEAVAEEGKAGGGFLQQWSFTKALQDRSRAQKAGLDSAQKRLDKAQEQVDAFWGAAQGVMTLWKHVKVGELDSLESLLKLELSFSTWLAGLSESDLSRINGAVEVFAAQLESGDTVDGVSDDVIGAIGEERVREGAVFVEWFEEHVADFHIESGHLVLAKALGPKCVYHAGKSGDKGVYELVWEKVARRWEWMSSHPGGFIVAGRELIALGRERIGRVLMQNANLGAQAVALEVAMNCGPEMGVEVREFLGIEPIGGGAFDEALELRWHAYQGEVNDSALGPGGLLVTAGEDNSLRVWNVENGAFLHAMREHTRPVQAVTTVGGFVVSSARYDGLRVWDLATGTHLFHSNVEGWVSVISIVDESTILTSGTNGLQVWSLLAGGRLKKTKTLREPRSGSLCGASVGNGVVVGSGYEGEILAHELSTKKVIGEMKDDPDPYSGSGPGQVRAFCQLPDGRLVSASNDRKIRVWPLSYDGTPDLVLSGHSTGVCAMAILDNGTVVSVDYDGNLRHWSVTGNSWQSLGVKPIHQGEVTSLQPLTGGRFLSTGEDGFVCVWDISRAEIRGQRMGHKGSIACGALLQDGRLVSVGNDHFTVIWTQPQPGSGAEPDVTFQKAPRKVPRMGMSGAPRGYHPSAPIAVAATAKGHALVSQRSGKITLWEEDDEVGQIGLGRDFMHSFSHFRSIERGSQLLALSNGHICKFDVAAMRGVRRLKDLRTCYDLLDEGRLVAGAKLGYLYTLDIHTWENKLLNRVGEVTITSVAGTGGDVVVAVNSARRGFIVSLIDGFVEELDTGLERVFTSLNDGTCLASTTDYELVVFCVKEKEATVKFGGIASDGFADFAWDAKSRILVLFQATRWIAYRM